MEKQPRREVPKEVQEARIRGDHQALSQMGRIGGEHAAALKLIEKKKGMQHSVEAALHEATMGEISSEGDVLPPNPEIIESLEEVLKE